MNSIDELLCMLHPLRPKEVAHWRRVLDTADARVRMLVERQIKTTAYRLLGSARDKLLLSLPPEQRIRGTFNLGPILYDTSYWLAGLRSGELIQNLAIFGRSGAGKTNAVFHLLRQLMARSVPFVFLDWKRTARHLIPLISSRLRVFTPGRKLVPWPFSSLAAPVGMESRVYRQLFVDMVCEAYTLGDGARSMLQQAVAGLDDTATLTALIEAVEAMPAVDRMRGWKLSAQRALRSLQWVGWIDADTYQPRQDPQVLLKQPVVIELDSVATDAKRFLIPWLCLWLYHARLAQSRRETLDLVIVVEEAHHVLYRRERGQETVMEMLLRQCREVGIGIIVVDQHPSLISPAALGNCYTSIVLNLKNPSDIRQAAALSQMPEHQRHWLSQLPVGQAVVKLQDRWRQPFLVQFPAMPINKGAMTDQALQQYVNRGFRTGSRGEGREGAEFRRIPPVPLADGLLNTSALRFLANVAQDPDAGVKQRYQRLGLAAGTGHRLKVRLLQGGWLEEAVVSVGRTRKVVLRLSKSGQRIIGDLDANANSIDMTNPKDGSKQATSHNDQANDSNRSNESLRHHYLKRHYAALFKVMGYATQIEASRVGGRVDVLATRGRESVGIEVETGRSDVAANVRHGLASRFNCILVAAVDEAALSKVERILAQENLLIPNRVWLIRAGHALPAQFQSTHEDDDDNMDGV